MVLTSAASSLPSCNSRPMRTNAAWNFSVIARSVSVRCADKSVGSVIDGSVTASAESASN